ncbi:hypothetical protein EXS62_01085 [Candidatus Kaiserbacteria bacterium]|nr:hypothetical protein [Candidatus Kaiserbacteria bacterium]
MVYFLLVPAAILDIVQFLAFVVFLALQLMTPVGGGVTGAAAAAWYCWNGTSGFISGVTSALGCAAAGGVVGAGASAFAVPLGMVVDFALSATVGGIIIIGLAYNRMFFPGIVLPRFLWEVMPFFNIFPVWTNMVWKSIKEKKKQDAEEAAAAESAAPKTFPATQSSFMQDIRPAEAANDNSPQPYAQAA